MSLQNIPSLHTLLRYSDLGTVIVMMSGYYYDISGSG